MLPLTSVTYVSRAASDLTDDGVFKIYKDALENNSFDGITGLLVYDGTSFVQIIEGTEQALLDLFQRLKRDARHGELIIVDEREIKERSFRDWSMKLLRIDRAHMNGVDSADQLMRPGVDPAIRAMLLAVIARMEEFSEKPPLSIDGRFSG